MGMKEKLTVGICDLPHHSLDIVSESADFD